MTLTEFLLARMAEDEADVEQRRDEYAYRVKFEGEDYAQRFDHPGSIDRAARDCDSKRRIVVGMQPFGPLDDIDSEAILGLLALPYADHPDYDEQWRP